MSKYEIIKLSNDKYEIMVLSTSYEDPLEELDDIQRLIREKKYKGMVIFDFLSFLGNNSNRFMECFFDGQNFDLSSFMIINIHKMDKLREVASNNFYSSIQRVENTVLTFRQKDLIASGVIL